MDLEETARTNLEVAEQYPLGREILSSMRLNLQHYHWVSDTGFILHPSIKLPSSPIIADVGCGNGIWSLDLARQLPSATIEACDISLAQAPPKQWWPKNVTFSERDIFAPIPAHLEGRYDVVHLRLFMCVVANGDPTPLLTQLLKLVKPGGYLQWQEYDTNQDKVITADGAADSAPKLRALRTALYKALSPAAAKASTAAAEEATNVNDDNGQNLRVEWVSNLHNLFAPAGAQLVAHENSSLKPELAIIRQEISFLSVRDVCITIKATSPDLATELLKMTGEAEEECFKSGRSAMVDSNLVTWIAKKN